MDSLKPDLALFGANALEAGADRSLGIRQSLRIKPGAKFNDYQLDGRQALFDLVHGQNATLAARLRRVGSLSWRAPFRLHARA